MLVASFVLAVGGVAHAADGCGTGCHATIAGACVVDGWGTGKKVWNECPATSRAVLPAAAGISCGIVLSGRVSKQLATGYDLSETTFSPR
jgi:hypothetical protein